ncbi:META domain-containing protein [Trujillonella humicola]|uniref:META domain-containing protein n=1 Tax=Trujillonella humicola TaxID=3383699 RepID=UPI003905811E
MPRLLLLAALGAVLLTAPACADPAEQPRRPDVLGSWRLVSGDVAGAALPLPRGSAATLVAEPGRLSGTAFCNHYFAGYRLDGDALVLDPIGQTEMACDPPVMAAESAFLSALAAVDRAARDGEALVLTGEGATLHFTREVPVPDRDPVGTRWVLDTLVVGELASSVQGEPRLELAADGTASGSTGCRGWSGPWRRDGDVLTLGPPAVEDLAVEDVACPPELAGQDEQVIAVLTAGATLAVDGDRLTLTAPDGRGLAYRAG